MVYQHAAQTATRRAEERESIQRRVMVAVDMLMIGIAVGAVLIAGIGASAPLRFDSPRLVVIAALVILWPLMLWDMQTRSTTVLGTGSEEYRRVLVASLWTLCLTAAGAYATGTSRGRDTLLIIGILGTIFLLTGRNIMRIVLHRQLERHGPIHRVFVVAPPSQEENLGNQLGRTNGVFAKVGGWPLGEGPDPDPAAVVRCAAAAQADTLLYAPGNHTDANWPRRLGWAMEGSQMSLLVSPALADVAGPRTSIEPVEGMALLRVDMPRFSGPARVVKRTIDVLVSAVGLVVLAIPLLLMAAAIKRGSPGPVFFKQRRAGVDGSTFVCWKFRTMHVDADAQREALREQAEDSGAIFKMTQDPRITRVGRFLRRFSLDELPQLFNVLVGDMSLVGPRPHPLDDVERYDDIATRRLLAKPGMTGLWQVSGRSDLTWAQAVTLDLYYIENWSMSLDMIIFLRTTKAVLTGQGAY